MGLLKNIFGKKDNNYYLELKETAEDTISSVKETAGDLVSTAQETAEDTISSVKETAGDLVSTAQETAEDTISSTQKIVENNVDEAQEAVKEKTATTKKQVKSKAASVKKTVEEKAPVVDSKNNSTAKSQKKQKTSTQASKPAPSYEPPFWVKAMYNNSNGNGKAAQSEKTFATDNLMPTISNARRRPGPSLNKFKDMANKARTPRG